METVDCGGQSLDAPQIAAIEKAISDMKVHVYTCSYTLMCISFMPRKQMVVGSSPTGQLIFLWKKPCFGRVMLCCYLCLVLCCLALPL